LLKIIFTRDKFK